MQTDKKHKPETTQKNTKFRTNKQKAKEKSKTMCNQPVDSPSPPSKIKEKTTKLTIVHFNLLNLMIARSLSAYSALADAGKHLYYALPFSSWLKRVTCHVCQIKRKICHSVH